jgi:hypothetical protein
VSAAWLEAFATDLGSAGAAAASLGTAPTCAVAGGVLANSVVRSVSRVGAPLHNWFFFSLHDGSGLEESISAPP